MPERCLLAFGIPVTKEAFLDDLRPCSGKDYAKTRQQKFRLQPEALWRIDHEPAAKRIQAMCRVVRAMGVHVIEQCTAASLAGMDQYDVFTIITHWDDENTRLEIADGMIESEAFERLIPATFRGVIELANCKSENLQRTIKRKRSNVVIGNVHPTSLDFRVIVYEHTIRLMQFEGMSYIDALTLVRIKLTNLL